MLSYEFYKTLHLISLIFFFGTLGASFYHDKTPKHLKIILGVSTFFILVAGMGLLAKLGIGHGGLWPGWAYGKLVLWLLLAILGPVLVKRVKNKKILAFNLLMLLGCLGIIIAVWKPF